MIHLKRRSTRRNETTEMWRQSVLVILLFSLLAASAQAAPESVSIPTPGKEKISDIIPPGMSAYQYFALGEKYKGSGHGEFARAAMRKAIEVDKTGKTARQAENYIKVRLTKFPAAAEAEHMNFIAHRLIEVNKKKEAKELLEKCIAKYPKFEFAYSTLASEYLDESNPKQAEKYLTEALKIHPDYSNALLYMSRVKQMQGNVEGAQQCVNKVREIDPQNIGIAVETKRIEKLQKMPVD